MTSSNGSLSAVLAICTGNSPVSGEFPPQKPVTRIFDGFFCYLRLNKPLSKQSGGSWFETPSRSLWRHCNDITDPLWGESTGQVYPPPPPPPPQHRYLGTHSVFSCWRHCSDRRAQPQIESGLFYHYISRYILGIDPVSGQLSLIFHYCKTLTRYFACDMLDKLVWHNPYEISTNNIPTTSWTNR